MNDQFNLQFLEIVRKNEPVKVLQILNDLTQKNHLDKYFTDDLGNTALHLSLYLPTSNIAWVLIKEGWNISTPNTDHKVSLHYAAAFGHYDIVSYFFDQNIAIEPRTNGGLTPLHLAAYNNKPESCKLLLEKGANVNNVDNGSRTPLNYAAFSGHASVISYLISKGANPTVQDDRGNMPIAYTIINKYPNALKLFPLSYSIFEFRNKKNQTLMNLAKTSENEEILLYLQLNYKKFHEI